MNDESVNVKVAYDEFQCVCKQNSGKGNIHMQLKFLFNCNVNDTTHKIRNKNDPSLTLMILYVLVPNLMHSLSTLS